MCASFSDDDIDKPVENATGDEVGVIATVEGAVAQVRPDPAVMDSIKSSLGWDGAAEERVTLDRASVREITDDAVRLEGELPVHGTPDGERDGSTRREPETDPTGGMSGVDETEELADERRESSTEGDAVEDRGRGAEVDPTELADRDTGFSARPDEDEQRTDAAVDVDDETQRTDAAVDPDDTAARTDAAVDPDVIREETADRGPTTEDGARGIEDGPEEQWLTDAGPDDETDTDPDDRADADEDR
ncbi:hypothetical protein [Natrinema sp. 74]|uniref:hypothetical protein n=1 Tax=Natrinema sp. 74 TaxID=3384159 RepID=UPI0038D37236